MPWRGILGTQRSLDCNAQSCIRRKASDDEEHLVFVRLQTESTDEVAAVVIARIERKLEGLGFGDEFEVVSDVVQNGLTTGRHREEMRTKWEHHFVRVLGGPRRFWSSKRQIFVER